MNLWLIQNIYTVVHKKIGYVYGLVGVVWGIMGGMLSVVVRGTQCSGVSVIGCGAENMYNSFITLHGLIMVFMFVMGVVIGGIGNYYVILLIGCCDVVYPRMNNLSMVIWLLSGMVLAYCLVSEYGGGAGWTLYPPLVISCGAMCGSAVTVLLVGLLINGIATTLSVANLMSTIMNLRVCGMTLVTSGVLVWCIDVVCILLIGVIGVLAVALIMILCDVWCCTGWFDVLGGSGNGSGDGGDSVLYQHLFWFFGHPEVYIMILPAFGVVSWCLLCWSGSMFGNGTMIVSVWCIGILGCIVWAHHMYAVGMDTDVRGYFSVVTMCIGLPTGNKIFNWCCTYYVVDGNRLGMAGSMDGMVKLVVVFIVMIVVGGSTGIMLANAGLDVEYHDSYFVVAHFHVVLSLGAGLGILLQVWLWLDSWMSTCGGVGIGSHNNSVVNGSGRMLGGGVISGNGSIIVFGMLWGLCCNFWVMHWCGVMPRRYYDMAVGSWAVVNSIGAVVVWLCVLYGCM